MSAYTDTHKIYTSSTKVYNSKVYTDTRRTYTDLHNKLKDNINVSSDTKITNQQVKFYNLSNEFWGKFKGDVDLNGSLILNIHLISAMIEDSILCGSILLPWSDITLDLFIPFVRSLSSRLYDDVSGDIRYLSSQIEKSAASATSEINNAISTLSDDFYNKLCFTSCAIDNNFDATKKYNSKLSAAITNMQNLISRDPDLSGGISYEHELTTIADAVITIFSLLSAFN